MVLMPGTFEVEDYLFDHVPTGWIDLNVPSLNNATVTATKDDFEDACYNDADWERDNADIINHPDNPDNKE